MLGQCHDQHVDVGIGSIKHVALGRSDQPRWVGMPYCDILDFLEAFQDQPDIIRLDLIGAIAHRPVGQFSNVAN